MRRNESSTNEFISKLCFDQLGPERFWQKHFFLEYLFKFMSVESDWDKKKKKKLYSQLYSYLLFNGYW